MPGMSENAFLNIKNQSHSITAEIEAPQSGLEGVILAQGGRFGGWAFYVKDGKPAYTYNWLGQKEYTIASNEPLPAGKATLRFDFAYDGGGAGKGGVGALFVDGKKVAEGRIEQTQCCVFSADEGADVGRKEGTPITPDFTTPFAFTGKLDKVTIALTDKAEDERAKAGPVTEENRVKRKLSD
jgi:arylsulfatase